MSYSQMSPKQQRTANKDVEMLFSVKAFHKNPDLKVLTNLMYITVKGKAVFLSTCSVDALRRLTDLLNAFSSITDSVAKHDVSDVVWKTYASWLEQGMQPTGEEFLDKALDHLLLLIKEYQFLVEVEGVELKEFDVIELGSMRLLRRDPTLIERFELAGDFNANFLLDKFKGEYWLIGVTKGSADIAFEKFEYRSALAVGVLAVCGAILYKGAIRRSRVRAALSPLESRKATASLMWAEGEKNVTLKQSWGKEQDLSIDRDAIAYLNDECFLKQLSSLPDLTDRSEVQDAIIRSLYWLSEAYRDRNPTMQFIKLWSCAESFFAIDKDKVVQLNAEGISAILVFAGSRIVEVENYPKFKSHIKKLYDLRSRAIHRAESGHIETEDLDNFSHWIAWLIISMMALSERGYVTLKQIREQTSRLDQQVVRVKAEKEESAK